MKNSFARKLTCNEKLYVALAECGINVTYRFLIRIDKELPVTVFSCAFKKALENCRAVNLKYQKGKWYFSEYMPEFKFIDSDADSIFSHPLSFLDHRKHTVCASGIYHKKTGSHYISIEFFHGACDGRGALNFVYDIFSALNGQPLTEYVWHITDLDIVEKHAKQHRERPKLGVGSTLKDSGGVKREQSRLNMLSTPYRPGGISGKLSFAISQVFSSTDTTVMIPVDVRKYSEQTNIFLFGNLSLPLFYQCGGKTQAQISDEIREKLKSGAALSKYSAKYFALDKIPLPAACFGLKLYLNYIRKNKSFVLGGIVSHLGDVDMLILENPFFKVIDMAVQAEKYPFCAFDIFSIGFGENLNIGITCDPDRIDEKVYRELTENIKLYVK